VGLNDCERYPQGWYAPFSSVWSRTAPVATSNVSVAKANCREGSGFRRTGSERKHCFNFSKESVHACVHAKTDSFFIRSIRGHAGLE